MKFVVGLSLISGLAAFSDDKVEHIHHQAILTDSCPSGSGLINGKCELISYDESNMDSSLASHANLLYTTHISRTLDEARESAAAVADFPWTFWPECFSNEDVEEPYCVFSDQDFASGRGIFIATTRTAAYAMLEKPAFKNPKALERVNKYSNPPFEQYDFPGKGRGLVANTTLHRGDQIFASTPLLITDSDMFKLLDSERLALLYRGVETLPTASQTQFWNLMGHFKGDPVEDRISTNNFDTVIDEVTQQALFPEIAMLNHDCRPNAAYFWDEESMTHYVHASRDIRPGEEITITYIDNEQEREARMARLKKNWGFTCACSACTAHPSLTNESDARLRTIEVLTMVLNDWSSESQIVPEMAELIISLFQQERLEASLATAYKHAAEVYSSFGKRWEAMKYATLSVEMSMLDKGFRHEDVREMGRMASQPELTWSWKKRVKDTKECGCGHAH
jgi:hypothetical protein